MKNDMIKNVEKNIEVIPATDESKVVNEQNSSFENETAEKRKGRTSKKQKNSIEDENNKNKSDKKKKKQSELLQKGQDETPQNDNTENTSVEEIITENESTPLEVQNIEWYACDLKDLIGKRPFKNFQPYREANIELYKNIGLYVDSMFPFLLKTMGFNYKNIPVCHSLILTTRLAPLVVEKLLVIEASGPATAKTSTLSYLGDYALIVEEPSRADLTGNKKFKTQTGLIKQYLIQIDEAGNMIIPDELIGIIKAITSQDEYFKSGTAKIEITLSILFTGNPPKEYFNSDGKTLNIDYCIKNLRELSLSLVEKFDYALLDRAVVTPGFLLSPIENDYILQSNKEIPKILFKDNTPDNIKIFEHFSLNVHTLWNTYVELRSEDLFYISDEIKNKAQDTTDRSITAINRLYTAFKRMYDPSNSYSKEKDLGLQELALTYRNYANGNYQPLNRGYIRYLLADIAKMIIQKKEIDEIYVYEHRILLKPKDENKFYKVTLDLDGQKENELEYDYYNSCSNEIKKFLSEVFSLECNGNVLIQEYFKPFSTSKALTSKIESASEKELKRVKSEFHKLKSEHEQFKENVYNAFTKLIEQINYNAENMLLFHESNFYKEEILSALTATPTSSSLGINLKAELEKLFPYSNIVDDIKNYDVSLDNSLKFINFYRLNSENLRY